MCGRRTCTTCFLRIFIVIYLFSPRSTMVVRKDDKIIEYCRSFIEKQAEK